MLHQVELLLQVLTGVVVVVDATIQLALLLLELLLLLLDALLVLLHLLVALIGLTVQFALHAADFFLCLNEFLLLEEFAFLFGLSQGLLEGLAQECVPYGENDTASDDETDDRC